MAIQYYADQNIEGKLTVSTVLRVNDSGSSIKGVGINTMNPGGELQVVGAGSIGNIYISANAAGSSVTDSLHIKKEALKASIINRDGGDLALGANSNEYVTIKTTGNVGIGTTGPGSKLEVAGEIDATTGDGYKINGKPWASLQSNTLFRLGDWDGEGFSTSIYDNNSANVVTIKDYGTMINCSDLSSSYGSKASLAVGTIGDESAGAAVITLANRDTTASAGDPTGAINFAIKADTGAGSLGYTSAIISGSIFANAGTGNAGGGILDFKTSPTGIGSSTATRMRINQLGEVGIGTTSPSAKLDVVQATTANGAAALHLIGPNTNPNLTSSVLIIEQSDGKKITMDGNDIDVSSGDLFINDYSGEDVTFGGQIKVKGLGNPVGDSYISNGNFGVGTTSPQEKLHVVEEVEGNTLIEVENTRGNSAAGVKFTSASNNYIAYTSSAGNFEILNSQTGKVNFVIAANGQGSFGNAVDTVTNSAFSVAGGGGISATKYINQRVVWATGFSHATNNSSAYYYFPVAGYLLTTSNQYYNNFIAPYAGRVRRITIRNVAGTSSAPTATTVNFRVSVNGSVIYTGGNVTIVGSSYNKYAMQDITPSDADFVASDIIQVAFRTNGLWRNAAASISLEYTE